MLKESGQAGASVTSQIEDLVSNDFEIFLAGVCRLEDIGEASPTYLAKEAFVAMVGVAVHQKRLSLETLQDEAQH